MDRMDGHPDSFCCAVLRLRLGGHSQLTASFQDPAWQLQVGQATAAAALLQVIRVGLKLAQRDSPPKTSTPHSCLRWSRGAPVNPGELLIYFSTLNGGAEAADEEAASKR